MSEPRFAPTSAAATIDVIVPILGDPTLVEGALARTLRSLPGAQRGPIGQVVLVLDGEHWSTWPMLHTSALPDSLIVVEVFKDPRDLPSVAINAGLRHVGSPHFTVLWPGALLDLARMERSLATLQEDAELGMVFGRLKRDVVARCDSHWADWASYGLLQYGDFISLHGAVLRTDAVREVGGFDTNPVFQKRPGWELMLRLARVWPIRAVGPIAITPGDECERASPLWDWEDYPFLRTLPFRHDLVHRWALRTDRLLAREAPSSTTQVASGPSLTEDERTKVAAFARVTGVSHARLREDAPLRVAVTGGFWEPVHNQLCFFNFFETERGRHDFDWRVFFDRGLTFDDVAEYDLVVVTRGRVAELVDVVDECRGSGLPTLYVLDDNWLTVGEDIAAYREVFQPGRPDHDNFLRTMTRCDTVLTFNTVLAEGLRRHHPRVVTMRPNIDLAGLAAIEPGRPSEYLVGYAGTPRHFDVAFEAAAEFVRQTLGTRFLFCGHQLPAALTGDDLRRKVLHLPYSTYDHYRQRLRRIGPSVLLAPLEPSITTRSKVFNKYLDITAAGAAGVYSGTAPYTDAVRHLDNGLLIPPEDNASKAAWLEALHGLHEDEALRRRLVTSATRDVFERYETRVVYDEFLGLMRALARRRTDRASGHALAS